MADDPVYPFAYLQLMNMLNGRIVLHPTDTDDESQATVKWVKEYVAANVATGGTGSLDGGSF